MRGDRPAGAMMAKKDVKMRHLDVLPRLTSIADDNAYVQARAPFEEPATSSAKVHRR